MKLMKLISKSSNNYFFIIGLISLFIVLFLYFFISFNITKTNQKQEVVISYADNISPAHQLIIDKFNEEYKGKIRVEGIDLPFKKFSTNERKELLARSLRSKSNKLDVFAVDLIWSARFATWAENLNKYIKPEELKNVLPIAMESCFYQNDLIALPVYLDVGMMYYRKDLIRSLPNFKAIEKKLKESITWDEFLEISKDFSSIKNPFYIFPADNYEGLICSLIEIIYNHNLSFFETKQINWKSEEFRNSLKLLYDLIYKYKITPEAVTDFRENTCYDYFIENNGVFLRGWPSFVKDYKNFLKTEKIDTLLVKAPLPHLKKSRPMSVLGGWNIMLSKYSKNKKESLEFIKFILREESQEIIYENGAYLPVLKSIYNNQEFLKSHEDLIFDKSLLDNGVHRPFVDDYTEISDVISFYANQVLKNKITIETALENTSKTLQSGELILR